MISAKEAHDKAVSNLDEEIKTEIKSSIEKSIKKGKFSTTVLLHPDYHQTAITYLETYGYKAYIVNYEVYQEKVPAVRIHW